MGIIRWEQGKVKIQGEKHYILMVVSASKSEQVRTWFENMSASLHLERIFVADIKGEAPLEQPIGLVALLRFDSIPKMRVTIREIATQLGQQDGWTFDFMKANWIDIPSALIKRAPIERKRLVTTNGRISFRNRRYHVSERLRGEYVELLTDNEELKVYYDGTLVKTFKLRS